MHAWLAEGLREGEQLDFKAQHYGNGDSQRRELAGDLAAFANHRGGLLILGVGENDSGIASSLPLVELIDSEQRRIHQIIAGNVFPHLPVEILPVTCNEDGRGVLILAVAPSTLRPHAIAVNDALRYPRRQGTVTRYLSESEVADLYRNRFAIERDDVRRIADMRREATSEIDSDGAVWVAVAGVPTGAGSMSISRDKIDETEVWAQQFIGDDLVAGFLGRAAPLVRPGLRRARLLTNFAHSSRPNYQYAELHTDGAAIAMHRLVAGRENTPDGEPVPVRSGPLVWTTATALNVVAKHAARAGGWGDFAVELAVFGPPRVLASDAQRRLVEQIEGARIIRDDVVSRHTLALEDLVSGTQQLLSATRLLLTDVFNAFGFPEVRALTATGALSASYPGQGHELQSWAQANGVPFE